MKTKTAKAILFTAGVATVLAASLVTASMFDSIGTDVPTVTMARTKVPSACTKDPMPLSTRYNSSIDNTMSTVSTDVPDVSTVGKDYVFKQGK